jgi:hypothetical protein
MKKKLGVTNLAIAALLIFTTFALSNLSYAKEVTLERLVGEVKVALLKVEQQKVGTDLPDLEKVELELNTVQKKVGVGKISLFIVKVGAKISTELTNRIKLTLKPPEPESSSDVSAHELADALADSILAGARAIAVAKLGSPPLRAEELTAEVKFAVDSSGGGQLSIVFPPFTIEGGAEVSASNIQSIIVTYRYKK